MDNIAIYGIRPATGKWSSDPVLRPAFVATAYQAAPGGTNVDLNIGDPIARVSDGSVALATAGATNPILGVIAQVLPCWDSGLGAMRYTDRLPGGTVWGTNVERMSRVLFWPAMGRYFEVDVDDAVTATTELGYRALIGQNVNLIYSAVSAERKAYPKVDISLNNTTNTFQFNIVDLAPNNNVDYSGANVKLIVSINLPDENPPLIAGV